MSEIPFNIFQLLTSKSLIIVALVVLLAVMLHIRYYLSESKKRIQKIEKLEIRLEVLETEYNKNNFLTK